MFHTQTKTASQRRNSWAHCIKYSDHFGSVTLSWIKLKETPQGVKAIIIPHVTWLRSTHVKHRSSPSHSVGLVVWSLQQTQFGPLSERLWWKYTCHHHSNTSVKQKCYDLQYGYPGRKPCKKWIRVILRFKTSVHNTLICKLNITYIYEFWSYGQAATWKDWKGVNFNLRNLTLKRSCILLQEV